MTKILLVVAGIVAVLGIAAVACDDDDPSEEDVTSSLCSDLGELRAADAAFDTLGPDSTLDEIRSVSETYEDALNAAIGSAGDLADVRTEPVDAAYDDLAQAIDDISGDATIPEALTSIEDELVALDNAYEQAFANVDCP